MIALAAAAIVCIFGAFLICVGILMLLKPQTALTALRHMGSTPKIHFSELSLRCLAGAGAYGFAAQSPYARAFQIAGIFLMVTSLLIMCVPHRFHNAYALWWADRFPPALVRGFGLLPIVIGGWLIAHVIFVW